MTDDIGYDALTQSALRTVMREALSKFADAPARSLGDHHFYITFRTKAPGVQIADYLVERFPDEMTIVVQYQFWDLEVRRDGFEIVLKFSGVPQHLDIPFSAVTRFVDPSVNFGLNFDKELVRSEPPPAATDDAPSPTPDFDGEAGTVVSLEAFRKK